VFGEWPHQPRLPTLLITTHYDVQPVGDLERWTHPPYAAVLEGNRMWGRGTSDAKGPVQSIISAAESVTRAVGRPLINLKVLFDGEEEVGSPSLPGALEDWRSLIQADAVVTFDGNSAADGRPAINFGGGGLLYVELDVRTGRTDVHSNRGGLVPNALWRLVWALGSLKQPDERITLDGFNETLIPLNEAERRLLESYEWHDDLELASLGFDTFSLAESLETCGMPGGSEAGPMVLSSSLPMGQRCSGLST
jgi:acetylornithine deacetylase/succinyl-diaminopimelate desuccinylase-like protein